jgi:hypothetical protein
LWLFLSDVSCYCWIWFAIYSMYYHQFYWSTGGWCYHPKKR